MTPDPPSPAPSPPARGDQTTGLLFAGLLFFALCTAASSIWLPANEKLFGLFSGIAGNFSGALFLRLKA